MSWVEREEPPTKHFHYIGSLGNFVAAYSKSVECELRVSSTFYVNTCLQAEPCLPSVRPSNGLRVEPGNRALHHSSNKSIHREDLLRSHCRDFHKLGLI